MPQTTLEKIEAEYNQILSRKEAMKAKAEKAIEDNQKIIDAAYDSEADIILSGDQESYLQLKAQIRQAEDIIEMSQRLLLSYNNGESGISDKEHFSVMKKINEYQESVEKEATEKIAAAVKQFREAAEAAEAEIEAGDQLRKNWFKNIHPAADGEREYYVQNGFYTVWQIISSTQFAKRNCK